MVKSLMLLMSADRLSWRDAINPCPRQSLFLPGEETTQCRRQSWPRRTETDSSYITWSSVNPLAGFAEEVRRGLSSTAKHLSPKYLYDELGSKLFEAICLLPEYYPTRAENEILTNYADEIVGMTGRLHRLVEMGSGSRHQRRA